MACRSINNAGIRAVLDFGILLLLLTQLTAHAQNEFTWEDASHNTRNLSDLEEILQQHRQWTESGGKSGTRADLRDANLASADLTGADLASANLRRANLTSANLASVNMAGTDLTGADLASAKMASANLIGSELTGANLIGADLTDAEPRDADLTRVLLGQADLSGTWFDEAKFDGAVFEPRSLPQLRGISDARNLELLTYDEPVALVQLRKQFRDGGFREQERKITYTLKRREAELSWERGTSRRLSDENENRAIVSSSDSILADFASFILNKVFFDWTCQYGMSPGRPLMLGVVIFLLCSLLYLACIHSSGEAGLYRVYSQSIHDDPSTQRRVTRISAPRIAHQRGLLWLLQLFRREFLLSRTSMFFSLMSAFNIGFRDINFGRWLRLLTRREFDIKAVGWVRVVAGWQSLISVYLIALWVLTYFGRPFG